MRRRELPPPGRAASLPARPSEREAAGGDLDSQPSLLDSPLAFVLHGVLACISRWRVLAAAAPPPRAAASAPAVASWSEEEHALKCAHCREPTPFLHLHCEDCRAVAFCGDACKRAGARAHARACKALAAANFAYSLGGAAMGVAGAMYNVGLAYEDGRGVARSDADAAEWYERAADKGDADAQFNLALFYRDGRGGLAADHAAKVRLLALAAAQGLADAESELGRAFWDGAGVARDCAEAVRWWRRAAARGDAPAMDGLCTALSCSCGVGAERSVEAAQ